MDTINNQLLHEVLFNYKKYSYFLNYNEKERIIYINITDKTIKPMWKTTEYKISDDYAYLMFKMYNYGKADKLFEIKSALNI